MGVKPSADIKHAYLTTSLAAADFFHLYILFIVQAKKKKKWKSLPGILSLLK